jgi:hypothetical protein
MWVEGKVSEDFPSRGIKRIRREACTDCESARFGTHTSETHGTCQDDRDQDAAFRFNEARLTLSELKISPPRLYTCRRKPISPTTSVGTISRHNGASDELYLPDEDMSREEPDKDAQVKVSKKEERESCMWEIMIRY